jgi:hypothetical protein
MCLYLKVFIKLIILLGVLTAVTTKSTDFWNRMPCSPMKIDGRFAGIFRQHLESENVNQAICSETSIDFFQAIYRCIPEERNLK